MCLLSLLFRGQNALGYRHYADDVLEYFVQKSVANGIDIIRIFDALNDIRNLETSINAAKKEKAHAQVAISYTLGETFTTDYYVNYAKQCEEIGADSICLKDMAALLTPYRTYELVKAIKENPSAIKASHMPDNRETFWKRYSNEDFKNLITELLPPPPPPAKPSLLRRGLHKIKQIIKA